MGNNSSGQLGDGTNQNRSTPVLAAESGATDVVCGVSHSLFIKDDGFLWGMGKNTNGELGDGTNVNRSRPVKVMLSTTTYSLIEGEGDADNSLFKISGTQLKTNEVFDFETKELFTVRVRATDPDGLFFEKNIEILINNTNEAPNPSQISGNTILENEDPEFKVGKFSTSDPENDKVTIQLLPDEEGNDNEFFSIKNNYLISKVPLDHEETSQLLVTIKSTDKNGLSTNEEFTINVTDVNEPPSDLNIVPSILDENSPSGTVFGNLIPVDEDENEDFSYTFVKELVMKTTLHSP